MCDFYQIVDTQDVFRAWVLSEFKAPRRILDEINMCLSQPSELTKCLRFHETAQGVTFWGAVSSRGHTQESRAILRAMRAELITKYPSLMAGEQVNVNHIS